jgi:hypothetical protein
MAKSKSGLASRFQLARDEFIRRTIASVSGEVGVGKTYFGCTGPAPILIQNIDKGTEGVVEQFRKEGKEIYEEQYEWSPGEVDDSDEEGNLKAEAELREAAIEIRNKWEKDYFYAIENGVRTVVQDNESRVWQVYRYAEFGGPNSGNLKDYDKLNLRFEEIINRAKACEVNLLMMRAMKDRWGLYGKPNKDGKRTFGKGGREVWGYEHLAGQVFTELEFVRRNQEEQDEAADGMGEYVIKIGKCRQSTDLQYTMIPRCTLPEFGTLIFPETEITDWE